MGKLLHQKLAQEAIIHSEFEDLHNEFQAFKKQVLTVFQKYDSNFRKVEASNSLNCHDFMAHEAAINLINEHCQCGNESLKYESLAVLVPQSPVLPVMEARPFGSDATIPCWRNCDAFFW